MRLSKQLCKYLEVALITARSRWTYIWDQLFNTWFLVVVMFVFVQLWKVTYAVTGSGAMAGYTLPEIIWYLVATESIIMSLPRIGSTIDNEVKNGDLAMRFLALPKDVLLHLLISDIRPISFGDALFGVVLVLVMVKLTLVKFLVFVAVSLLAAIVWLALFILSGSLVFFIGNSETVSSQFMSMVLHFATYPTPIFDDVVKILLFTVLPAGFLSTLPVELVREFHLISFLELLGAAMLLLAAAIFVFRRGLERYESGNLMVMRS